MPITRDAAGRLALSGDGEPVEWVVEMHRLPADRMLNAQIQAHAVTERDVASLAQVLGDFYAAAPALAVEPVAYRNEIEAHVRANRTDLLAATKGAEQARVRRASGAVTVPGIEFRVV